MQDAGLSNSPRDARTFEVTDAQLSTELKRWTGATPALHPVGELLDRHWEAGVAYARLCTADARSAGMLTTAAFTRLFGETLRQTGPTAAWRPQLLVAVRRLAAEWDTDHRQEMLHPALRSGANDTQHTGLLPPANRRLLAQAFQRLPQSARCLLWHTEVEAEPLAVPAGLLGLDEESARVDLGRARERLRDECLHVHSELAPEQECRRYLRMLDVTYRRGGVDIDPDLRAHLNRCGHCSETAEQLHVFNAGLGLPLAEAVLGWGASAYVESRATRPDEPTEPAPEPAAAIAGESFFADGATLAPGTQVPGPPQGAPGRPATGAPWGEGPAGEGPGLPTRAATPAGGTATPAGGPVGAADGRSASRGTGPRRARRAGRRTARRTDAASAARADSTATSHPGDPAASPHPGTGTWSTRAGLKAARRAARRRNLTAAVATVSALVVLPLLVWSALDSGDDAAPAAQDVPSDAPDSGDRATTGNPSWAGAAEAAKGDLQGRLYNIGSGLCVGVVGKKAVAGAETELADCSSAAGQRWSYETDGLLRSGADPDLCLDSHLGYSVRLAPCTASSKSAGDDVRYDFTLQGMLVPRFDQELALSPAATDGSGALVLKARDDEGDAQHWVIDTSKTELQMEVVNWGSDAEPRAAKTPASTPAPTPEPSRAPKPTPSATRPTPEPTPTSPSPADTCSSHPYSCSWDGRSGSSGGGYGGSGGYGSSGQGGYGGGYGGYGGGYGGHGG